MTDAARKMLAALWAKYRERVEQRLDVIENVLASAQPGRLSGDQRASAIREAHKLAGCLGMFGLHDGTEQARIIETELQQPHPDLESVRTATAALRALLDARA